MPWNNLLEGDERISLVDCIRQHEKINVFHAEGNIKVCLFSQDREDQQASVNMARRPLARLMVRLTARRKIATVPASMTRVRARVTAV